MFCCSFALGGESPRNKRGTPKGTLQGEVDRLSVARMLCSFLGARVLAPEIACICPKGIQRRMKVSFFLGRFRALLITAFLHFPTPKSCPGSGKSSGFLLAHLDHPEEIQFEVPRPAVLVRPFLWDGVVSDQAEQGRPFIPNKAGTTVPHMEPTRA